MTVAVAVLVAVTFLPALLGVIGTNIDRLRTPFVKVRAEVDAALGRVAGQVEDARRIGLLNVLASCITLAAAAVALWVALR